MIPTKTTALPLVVTPLMFGVIIVAGGLATEWHQTNREIVPLIQHTPSIEATQPQIHQGDLLHDDVVQTGRGSGSVHANASPVSASVAGLVLSPLLRSADANLINPGKYLLVSGRPSRTDEPVPSSDSLVKTADNFASPGGQSPTGGHFTTLPVTLPQNEAAGVPNPSIPVVFGDPSVLGNLTDGQKATIAQIASNFTKSVQSSGAAPNTEEYRQAWDTAAYRADEYFRGQFGIPAFNVMQMSRTYRP